VSGATDKTAEDIVMKIKCSEFENGRVIPDRFSQYDANRSPPLDFVDVPSEAKSLALIMDDPDAPRGTFTHWVAFNIDANTAGFRENKIPQDVRLGRNDYDQPEYAGPKPPDGEHRYFFHTYALDTRLDLPTGASRDEVESALRGHVIAEAELMGRYATPNEARR
jgi:Raf kinase inhibitor-like YbhB/YbcL family protein